jgi:hypothetical protein
MTLWRRPAVRWTVLALLGVVIATAVTIAATRLVGQHVALGGEPRLTDNLVALPARTVTPAEPPVTTPRMPPTTTTTATPPPSAPPPSDDEHGGDGDDDD